MVEREATRTRSLNEAIFARALEDLDIQPFTIPSVQAYKARMLKEACKGQSLALTRYMHQSGSAGMLKGQTVVHCLGWPTLVASFLTSIIGLVGHGGFDAGWGWDGHQSIRLTKYLSWAQVGYAVLIPALGAAAWTFLMFLRHKKANTVLAQWRQILVGPDAYNSTNNSYKEAIPAFVVQRMLSLKKALPEVTFSVEQLEASRVDLKTEKREPLPPDPFLIATFREISCYVDVWDEPGFEGRRRV